MAIRVFADELFIQDRTANGKTFRMLTIIDEYTRECLSIRPMRRINSQDVLEELYHPFLLRGMPEYIRSDNGPEFTAKSVRNWLHELGVANCKWGHAI